jgi:hypothetical protein
MKCSVCEGRKKVPCLSCNGVGTISQVGTGGKITCTTCKGGKTTNCSSCLGKGHISKDKKTKSGIRKKGRQPRTKRY